MADEILGFHIQGTEDVIEQENILPRIYGTGQYLFIVLII